jgi:hypothetical protein
MSSKALVAYFFTLSITDPMTDSSLDRKVRVVGSE